jgi:uncharacterized FAD-dependent dehydrogenase
MGSAQSLPSVMSDPERSSDWRVLGLELGLDEPESVLRERAAARAGIAVDAVRGLRMAHKSLDARRRGGQRSLRFVVHVDIELARDFDVAANVGFERACRAGRVVARPPSWPLHVTRPHPTLVGARVAVVGAGPAGLFAALSLARSGVSVDLFDRGPALAERSRAVARFARTRELDPEANLLFGEGGAGTYSDGKIYTRIDHPLESSILAELVACGADEEIAWDARAHIGTDRLHRILPVLRSCLEAAGVRLHWGARLTGWGVEDRATQRAVRTLHTTAGDLDCDAVMLALGHSARDSLEALHAQGLVLEAKPFQLGVRIEHPQSLIDRGRYGDAKVAARLGASYYGLACKPGDGLPGAHSFCMCPGGQIVASVNTHGLLCTNGMSNSRHSSPYANAAVVTTLGVREYGDGVFAGVDHREALERSFFSAGGGDWTAPAQRAPDFIAGRASTSLDRTSYRFGCAPGRIDALLPERVRSALRRALARFDRQIPGFAGPEAMLVGIESRSSGAIRMPRDEVSRLARGFTNVLPIGEGAGYAGGIMSAAIDGARSARELLERGLRA